MSSACALTNSLFCSDDKNDRKGGRTFDEIREEHRKERLQQQYPSYKRHPRDEPNTNRDKPQDSKNTYAHGTGFSLGIL